MHDTTSEDAGGARRPWLLPLPIVRALCEAGTPETHPRGTLVVEEGTYGDRFYVIVSGRVRVFLADEDGREMILNEHGPGEHFGEMMLDHGPRSASVITLERTALSVLTRDQVEAFLAANPDACHAMIHMLIARARSLTRTVGNLALLDVYGRVARLLLDHAVERDGRLVVTERFTQADIARRVGSSREMVSRIFTDLRRGGYIENEGDGIVIRRPPPKGM